MYLNTYTNIHTYIHSHIYINIYICMCKNVYTPPHAHAHTASAVVHKARTRQRRVVDDQRCFRLYHFDFFARIEVKMAGTLAHTLNRDLDLPALPPPHPFLRPRGVLCVFTAGVCNGSGGACG